jgi:argininosuccinate lyase
MNDTTNKSWGGRFTEPTDAFVEAFTASVQIDQKLYRHDIEGSRAHARMLAHVDVITETECNEIIHGLDAIEVEIENGTFPWSVALEDVHMNIELKRL